VDTISFGPGREPRRWHPRNGWPGRRAWLVAAAAAVALTAAGVTAAVLLTSGPARQAASAPAVSAPLPRLLSGVPVHGASTDLFLAGENFWQVGPQPRAVASGFLVNGLSPLLPPGHGAEADQLAAVPGGVVAHISDISTGITYGAPGRVVFLPAGAGPARVIARATMIAVSPGGRQVWVQTAIQMVRNGQGVPLGFTSPTWAVNLVGRRVSPVLRLPFGLAGATGSGPLTQNLDTGRLQLWNGTTGRPVPLRMPSDASFAAAAGDRVTWWSCGASCRLHVTDLRTGADAAVPAPAHWLPPSPAYPPAMASFDPSGRRLVLPLSRADSAGRTTVEALFVADTATGTMRMIPGTLVPLPASGTQPLALAGAWDRRGLLWAQASVPDSGYYQLGFWTGAGPLRVFPPARGSPDALSPPGPG